MKRMLFFLAFASASALAEPVSVDVAAHSVSFEVVSTDCGIDTEVEFLFVGPGSDRDYESMFLTVASVAELNSAFEKAGFVPGTPVYAEACAFWPVGGELRMEPDVWTLLADTRNERKAPAVYTGGTRGPNGTPEATTNMPLAVFALYDCPQSLIQFDDTLPQSATYGRFKPAVKIPQGEKRIIKISRADSPLPKKVPVQIAPGTLMQALEGLKAASVGGEIVAVTDFSPELTVEEAAQAAAAFALIDSPRVKFNGFTPGQFYYRAFLPLEKWRDRSERLTQPYEIRLQEGAEPRLTTIKEDWTSDPGSLDPKLVVNENVPFASLGGEGDLTDTALVFAPKTMKLGEVFAVRKLLPARVSTFYVYGE